jgi:ornithine cyclodeaminase
MRLFSAEEVRAGLPFPELVDDLRLAFQGSMTAPARGHFNLPNPPDGEDTVLLVMPAWQAGKYAGVKTVTVSPENAKLGGPAILGVYSLINARTGEPLAILDAPMITVRRTAAASALASTYLSRPDSRSMLMIGTGVLAPHFIEAHRSVRPIDKVWVWGRNLNKAKDLADACDAEPVENIADIIGEADIVTAATMSPDPLILGEQLVPGQHIDLIGAYRPDRREADDEVMRRGTLFVDTFETATEETGDIVIPLKTGVITQADLRAEMADLCTGRHPGRRTDDEITVFKSCGSALEDLAAAIRVWEASQA